MTVPGAEWGRPRAGDPAPVVDATGDDADLAGVVLANPGAVVRFVPGPASDLARALGLTRAGPGDTVLPCDGLRLADGRLAVNAVVAGIPPDRLRGWHRTRAVHVEVDGRALGVHRATSVVVASGQFLRGADVVPRGHPGDGLLEVQVYALGPGERRAMRRRLGTGTHVPHPRVVAARGRAVTVVWGEAGGRRRGAPVEVDGRPAGRAARVEVRVEPGRVRVLC